MEPFAIQVIELENNSSNTTQINALTSQIFADNLNKMKEAAIFIIVFTIYNYTIVLI
jgi:hypothetical protein